MPESTVGHHISHHAAPNLEKYVDYRLRESGTKEGTSCTIDDARDNPNN
jgi:hypothetical protein